jgi:nitrate/nitrite transport system substrate-binding protein
MIFSDRSCNYPHAIYGMWFLTQHRRWGMIKGTPDYKGIVKRVMRSDIYLEAMKELGVSKPIAELTRVTLFDSALDAADPEKYATSFPVHSLAS